VATEAVQIDCLNNRITDADLQSPALLKIDVQGYELSVLQGCLPLLARFSYVYVECSFVELYAGQALACEVIAYLHSHEFDLRGVYNVLHGPQGEAIQADMLFSSRR
jgi:hypothetical protein